MFYSQQRQVLNLCCAATDKVQQYLVFLLFCYIVMSVPCVPAMGQIARTGGARESWPTVHLPPRRRGELPGKTF